MPDLSTLLFFSCIGCTQSSSQPVQPPFPTNQVGQALRQDDHLANPQKLASVATPEVSPVSLELKSKTIKSLNTTAQNRPDLFQPVSPKSAMTMHRAPSSERRTSYPMIKLNSHGQAVTQLQTQLQRLGYYTGAIDGIYGSLTEAATINYQQDKGLAADGIVGPETWAMLQTSSLYSGQQVQEAKSLIPIRQTKQFDKALSQSSKASSLPSSSSASSSYPRLTTRNPNPSMPLSFYFFISGWAGLSLGGWMLIIRSLEDRLDGGFADSLGRADTLFEPSHLIDKVASEPIASAMKLSDREFQKFNQHSIQTRIEPNRSTSQLENIAKLSALLQQSSARGIRKPIYKMVQVKLAGNYRVYLSLKQAINFTQFPQEKWLEQQTQQSKDWNNSSHVAQASQVVLLSKPINYSHETTVATLPQHCKEEGTYTYKLLNDADGLFVLRGNELRVVNHYLSKYQQSGSVITVRRTDLKGISIDKSFKLDFKRVDVY